MSTSTGKLEAKETAENLMGVLIECQTRLLETAKGLTEQTVDPLNKVFSEEIVPKLVERLHGLRGERPLASECDGEGKVDPTDAGRERAAGSSGEFAAPFMPNRMTHQLTYFLAELSRALIHYNVLHSLALAAEDAILAGIAWTHAKEIKGTIEQAMLLLPAVTTRDFGGDDKVASEATEQLARIWTTSHAHEHRQLHHRIT